MPLGVEFDDRGVPDQTLHLLVFARVAVDGAAGVDDTSGDADDGCGVGEDGEQLAGGDALAGLGDGHLGDGLGDLEGMGVGERLGGASQARYIDGVIEQAAVVGRDGFVELAADELVALGRNVGRLDGEGVCEPVLGEGGRDRGAEVNILVGVGVDDGAAHGVQNVHRRRLGRFVCSYKKRKVRVQVLVEDVPVAEDFADRGDRVVHWSRHKAHNLLARLRREVPQRTCILLSGRGSGELVVLQRVFYSDNRSRRIDMDFLRC